MEEQETTSTAFRAGREASTMNRWGSDSGTPAEEAPSRLPAEKGDRRRGILQVVGILAVILAVGFGLRSIVPKPAIADLELSGRLALLPLVDATGDRADAWVEEGLAELAFEALGRSPGVEVVPLARLWREVRARGLEGIDEASRERLRRLALATGADLVVDAEIGRLTRGGAAAGDDGPDYRINFRVFDDSGEVSAGEVEGTSALAAADLLVFSLVRGLREAGEPMRLPRLFTRDAFLDRLYAMGRVELRSAGPEASRPYFDIVLRGRPYFLHARLALAECERRQGRLTEAGELALAVLEESEARGDSWIQARVLGELGRLAAIEGNVDLAANYFVDAAEVYDRRGDRAGRAKMLVESARLALGREAREEAAEFLGNALRLQNDLGDILGQIDSRLELGSLFLAGADLAAAEEHLGAARDLARGLEDRYTEMRALASLGEVAWRGGDLDQAEARWQEALAFYDQRGDKARSQLLHRNLASLYLRRVELAEAEGELLETLALATELGNESEMALASLHLSWVLLKRGYPFQARPHLDRALTLDRWLEDERVGLQRVIAWSAYEDGNFRLAVSTQEQVVTGSTGRWVDSDESFLVVYRRALDLGERLPVPGADGYVAPVGS